MLISSLSYGEGQEWNTRPLNCQEILALVLVFLLFTTGAWVSPLTFAQLIKLQNRDLDYMNKKSDLYQKKQNKILIQGIIYVYVIDILFI